jgi:hypothetical protein
MLRFPNTSHIGSLVGPLQHRRTQNEALLDWMNRYVLADAHVGASDESNVLVTEGAG